MPHDVGEGRALARGGKSIVARVAAGIAGLALPMLASATLTIAPITWNVVGLDSNSPATGPQHFPIGARVCSDTHASNVAVTLSWDSNNAYIDTRPGSLSSLSFASISAGTCADAYFEAEVTKDAAAFDTTRRYHIGASDAVDTANTPVREIYVEHLISQNRNSITGIKVNGATVAPGGSVGLVVGNTYTVELDGGTATQGYNQFESFINFSNAVFQVLSVSTSYSANNSPLMTPPFTTLYANACGWENNFASPNYRSCVGGDYKAGGTNVVTVYTVKIISGGGTSQKLSSLLYDFSGSSFHYNADYGINGFVANIVDPANLTFSQTFMPSAIAAGGTSTLSFIIGNPNPAQVSGVGFSDSLPKLASGVMLVASPASYTTQGCGSPIFAPVAGATSLAISNITLPANGSCRVSVQVSVPPLPASGTYVNTSGNLVVGSFDTGRNTLSALDVFGSAPPAPVCGLTLAQWTMTGAATTPPAPSTQAADVGTAATSAGAGLTGVAIDTALGNPLNAWKAAGWDTAITLTTANDDYFQFAVDTSKYSNITFAFDERLANQTHGPQSLQIYTSTDNANYTALGAGFASSAGSFANHSFTLGAAANASGTTYVRLYGWNSANTGNSSTLTIDNVTIGGCQTVKPQTIAKSFAPTTIGVGGVSTLTFTVTNPNTAPITGVKFDDTLPGGLQVAATPNASNSCSASFTPAAGDTTLNFGQPTGGIIAGSASCTVRVDVTATAAGSMNNISGFVASTEGGSNGGNGGSASAALQVVTAPTIAALAAPASVQVNGNSVVTYTLTNPNAAGALSAVSFAANYPANLVNAANPPANSCGGTLTAVSGGAGVSLGGGAIAAGGSCTVSVPVTSATTGAYTITTGNVSDTLGGSGNTASASVTFTPPTPGISTLKQVATSPSGPWKAFVTVAPGAPVYYRFTVENTGDAPFASFTITDPTIAVAGLDPASCVWQTPNVPSTLPALPVGTALVDPTATCVAGPLPAMLGGHENTASGHGVFNGTIYDSVASTAEYVGALPGFSLVKEVAPGVDGPWATTLAAAFGSDVFYRFTLINNGGLDLTNLSVGDDMLSTGSCVLTDPLTAGDATVCTLGPVQASQPAGTVVTNTATGIAAQSVTSQASASYTVIGGSADLAVTNDDAQTTLFAGSSTQYTVTVTNIGPADVSGAKLIDNEPAGLSFAGWNCTVTNPGSGGLVTTACASPGGTGSIDTTLTLQPGAVITLQIAANVHANASGSITNTATIAPPAGITDPTPANDSASDTDTVTPAVVNADLAITVTDGVSSVVAGSPLTYTVGVMNNGPAAVSGATVSDVFPAVFQGAAWTCVASGGAACPAPGGAVNLAALVDLPVGGQVIFTVTGTVAVTATGTISNTANVNFAGVDTNPANNSATDSDTIVPAADLAVSIDDAVASVAGGQMLAYDVRVTNVGVNPVTSATLVVPPAIGLVKGSISCAAAPGNCTVPPFISEIDSGYTLPTLNPGDSFAITVVTAVTATQGSVTNIASVAVPGSMSDVAPANNTSSDVDVVTAPPVSAVDVYVTLDDGAAFVPPGTNVTYTLDVGNMGPDAAFGVPLAVTFPAQLVNVTWSCAAATPGACPEPASGSGDIDAVINLPVELASQFTINATVAPAAVGPVVVSANAPVVSATQSDVNPANNGASDTDTVGVPPLPPDADLGVTISDGVANVTTGTSTTYTITVVNNGPDPVTGAILANPGVSGLDKTSVACASPTCTTPPTIAELESGAFALPMLAVGQSYVLSIATDVTGAPGVTPASTATISVPAGVTDAVAVNNSATDTDTITAPPPGPPVVKTSAGNAAWVQGAGPVVVDPGVTVADPGSATEMTGIVAITGAFNAGDVLAFVNDGATMGNITGSYNAATGVLTLVSSGGTATVAQWQNAFRSVTFTDVAGSPNLATRTVSFTADNGTQTSNTAARAVTLSLPAPIAVDVSVSVDDDVTSVVTGASTTYTVIVTNHGPASVTGTVLVDPAAIGLAKTAVACASAPGACTTPTTPTIAELEAGYALPALAPGQTYALAVSATVNAAAGASVTDTASIAMPAGFTNTSASDDASDTDIVTAVPPPTDADLALTLSASSSSVSAGGNVTYTLVVSNNGPADVANATVTDVAPAGVTFGNWTCAVTTPGSGTITTACGAAAGSGNLNTTVMLNRGGVLTYTIAASVAANASGNLSNVASVNAPAGITDSVTTNNSASASVNVQAAPPPPPAANPQAIPTLSEWALMLLALMMFGVAGHALRGRVPRR